MILLQEFILKRYTITDIARLAEVSPATVSLVMNNKKGISEATRLRVQAILDETGFVPNAHTQRLKFKKSSTVQVVMRQRGHSLFNQFSLDNLMGIIQEAKSKGYNILLDTVDSSLNMSSIINSIQAGDADGVIFLGNLPIVDELINDGFPVLYVDAHVENATRVPTIEIDYYDAAFKATETLIKKGHKDIAIITSDASATYFSNTFGGYSDALAQYELICRPEWIQKKADSEGPSAISMINLLNCKYRPSAVFCAGDILAIEAMKQIKNASLNIPKDIAVISVDDIIISQYLEPGLSTMAADNIAIGKIAMDTIYAIMNGIPYDMHTLIKTKYVERESV